MPPGKWLPTPQVLARQSAALLREIGNISPNYELSSKDLADGKWRQTARDLLDGLLKGSQADFATKFDELIIVPDGLLWYVPFEALQVQADGQLRPLISRFRIRYVPTAGLATATLEMGRRRGNTAIVVGKLNPKLDDEVVESAVKDLSKSLPGCVTLKMPLPAPAPIYANFIDRLVVLDELSPAAETDPYGWSPLPTERTKTGGPLGEWFLLAAARAGRSDPARLPLGVRKFAEEDRCRATLRPRRGGRCARARQRDLPQPLRDDVHGDADGAHQPLAERGADEPRPGAGIHPGVAAHHARRRLAAGRPGGQQFALDDRGRTAAEESPPGSMPTATRRSGPRIRSSGQVTCWSTPAVPSPQAAAEAGSRRKKQLLPSISCPKRN